MRESQNLKWKGASLVRRVRVASAPMLELCQCMLHCFTAPLLLLQLAAIHDCSLGLPNIMDVEVLHVLQGRMLQVLQKGGCEGA
eukprot:3510014-Heterocapsa_arctica.AAC.1